MNDRQALLTGYLMGSVMKLAQDLSSKTSPKPLYDKHGNYLPEFLVNFPDGTTLKVKVEVYKV